MRKPIPALAALALILSSCGGSNSGSNPPELRIVDATYGPSTYFDVLVNSVSVATDMTYGQATAFQAAQNSNTVDFEPAGTTTTVLTGSFGSSAGSNDTVFALQLPSAFNMLTATQDNSSVSSGMARLSFVHAYPGQNPYDIYITAPSAALPSTPSIPSLTYGGGTTSSSAVASAEVNLASGDWRVRAVASGDATQTVIFDSGPMTLASGADLLLAAEQTSGSAGAFAFMSLDDSSNVGWVVDQRVQLRIGNFAPALGAIDAYLDPSGTANDATNLFSSDLALGATSGYQFEFPGAYEVSMALTGQTLGVIQSPLALTSSTALSVFAIGVSGQPSPANLQLLVLTDDLTAPLSGVAKLRVVQLAPDLQPVDVVALDLSGTTPAISERLVIGLAYGGASAYLPLPPGTYNLALVPTGADTPLLPTSGSLALSVAAGGITTLVVDGCQNPGTGVCGAASAALQLLPLQDN